MRTQVGEEVTFLVASQAGRVLYSFEEDCEDRAVELAKEPGNRRLLKVTKVTEEVNV